MRQKLTDSSAKREKVPGTNPAYYSREKAADQLLSIDEFTMRPTPPLSSRDNRIFFYLGGSIAHEYPGLANSTLTVIVKSPATGAEYKGTRKISEAWLVTVRREDGAYGGPLVVGQNELVGDQELPFGFGHAGHGVEAVDVEVVGRLPDGRVLFGFEARVEMEQFKGNVKEHSRRLSCLAGPIKLQAAVSHCPWLDGRSKRGQRGPLHTRRESVDGWGAWAPADQNFLLRTPETFSTTTTRSTSSSTTDCIPRPPNHCTPRRRSHREPSDAPAVSTSAAPREPNAVDRRRRCRPRHRPAYMAPSNMFSYLRPGHAKRNASSVASPDLASPAAVPLPSPSVHSADYLSSPRIPDNASYTSGSPVSPYPPQLPPIPRVASQLERKGARSAAGGPQHRHEHSTSGTAGNDQLAEDRELHSLYQPQHEDPSPSLDPRRPSSSRSAKSSPPTGFRSYGQSLAQVVEQAAQSQTPAQSSTHLPPLSLSPNYSSNSRSQTSLISGISDRLSGTPKPPATPTAAGQKSGKSRLRNPMSLLMRRRSSQPLENLSDEALVSHRSPGVVPPIPENYDPSIRGRIVHDFSAPRINRNFSYNNAYGDDQGRSSGSTPGESDPYSPPKVEREHTPVFREHFDDDTSYEQSQAAIRAEQLANNDFVKRNSMLGLALPPPSERTPPPPPPPPKDSPPVPPAEHSLPLPPPPEQVPDHHSSILSPVQESPSQTSPPQQTTPRKRKSTKTPPASRSRATSVTDPSFSPAGLPTHLTSRASRFSFQIAGNDSAQEKVLEERHKKKAAEQASKEVRKSTDTLDDEYDQYEMDDFDMDGGFEEDIPMLGEEDDFGGLGDHTLSPGIAAFDFSSSLIQPMNNLMSPMSMNNGLQTPRDANGNPIGFAMSGDMLQKSNLPAFERQLNRSNAPIAEPRGLGLMDLQPGTADPSTMTPDDPPGEISDALVNGPDSRKAYLDDDMYFDDGMIDELGDVDAVEFDENVFDDPTGPFFDRKVKSPVVEELPSALASHPLEMLASETGYEADNDTLSKHLEKSVPSLAHKTSTAQPKPVPDYNNLDTYHSALAEAANRAEADGRFARKASIDAGQSNFDVDDSSSLSNSRPSLIPDDGRFSQETTGFPPDDDVFGMSSSFVDDYDYSDYDSAMEDDPMIAAANAEALAYDSEGFYGQEFGFYANAQGETMSSYGGFFGPSNLGRTVSGRNVVHEPNLTPITERSEYSTRNSFVSLNHFRDGQQPITSPGLAQLARISPYGWRDDEDMSLDTLMKLRKGAFGGSSASLPGSTSASPRNSSPMGMQYIPSTSSPAGHRMVEHNESSLESDGSQALDDGYEDEDERMMDAVNELPEEYDDDDDEGSAGGEERAESPTLTASDYNSLSSPFHGQNDIPPIPQMALQSPTPMPLSPPPPLPSHAQPAIPPTSQTTATFSQNSSPPLTLHTAFYTTSPSHDTTTNLSSPTLHSGPRRQSLGLISPISTTSPVTSPGGGSAWKAGGHSRNGSAADSVAYVRELDELGGDRWVLERRRTAESGEAELLVGGSGRVSCGLGYNHGYRIGYRISEPLYGLLAGLQMLGIWDWNWNWIGTLHVGLRERRRMYPFSVLDRRIVYLSVEGVGFLSYGREVLFIEYLGCMTGFAIVRLHLRGFDLLSSFTLLSLQTSTSYPLALAPTLTLALCTVALTSIPRYAETVNLMPMSKPHEPIPQHHKSAMAPQPDASLRASRTTSTANKNVVLGKRKADEMIKLEDEDLDDDDDDKFTRHDPDSEPFPDLPIYRPTVKEVQLMCTELVQRFQEFIRTSPFQDEETVYLLGEFTKLEKPPYEASEMRFGIVGDAGQGKSLTFNSVLGEKLAMAADDGDCCTFVVQEYAEMSPMQTAPYQAEVEFFSRQACVDIVKEQFAHYYAHMTIDEHPDEEDVHETRQRAETAMTTFTALFMSHPEFANNEVAEEFLGRANSAEDPTILNKLIKWTERILEKLLPAEGGGDITILTAPTAAALTELIQPFVKTVPYPSFEGTSLLCCPHPLVKKVKTRFASRILEQGLIIADLPGTSDKNRARVATTKRYLQICDISIVVHKMGRAIDHAGLNNQINEAFKRRRSGSIIVVCTGSDDLNVNIKQTFASTPAEEKKLADITKLEDLVRTRIHSTKALLSSPEVRSNPDRKLKLRMRVVRLEREYQALARRRKEVRVLARNRHVKEGIAEQYRRDTKDPSPLPIFCVSNTAYIEHLGYNARQPPSLSLQATGIPDLRNAIYSMPADGKWKTLVHYTESQLKSILNTVEMSCTVSKIKRKQELNKTFQKSRLGLRSSVQSIADGFMRTDVETIFTAISTCESIWINRARRKCELWKKFPAPGHRAVVKRYGTWGTKKVSPQNWNKELLVIIQADLDPLFEKLHNTQCNALELEIAEVVGEAIGNLNEALNVDPAASLSGAIKAFRDNLTERKIQVGRVCEKFKDGLKKDIREVQVHAVTDGEGEEYYFVEAMKAVYETASTAAAGRGQKLHDVRCNTFEKLLCAHNGVFMHIQHEAREDFKLMFDKRIDALVKELDTVFSRIQHDVNKVCSTKEDESEAAKKFRAGLLDMLPAARETLNGEVKRTMKLCQEPKSGE
ncbi:hypothetical protein BDV95DRAFT_598435 [Massariosphaeria phaeospora]|uniref:DUF7605 domain-containing protein n=1 Tax=Massariosphaeria phaeospora TaxID=100035 RepID=A0A7C8MH11_9PLEO|nr:hypothetical protein BDV95DRAFT_598435 [Massariosphaeria phaeospora]